MLDVSILVIAFNTKELTLGCLESIFDSKPQVKFKVYLLDNGSDATYEIVKKKFPDVEVIKSEVNTGFSKGNNLLIKKVYKKSRYAFLLNSDTKILPSSLDNLISFADKNSSDITGCYLENPDGSFQPNAGDIPTFLPIFNWLSGIDGLMDNFFKIRSLHQNSKKFYTNGSQVGWVSGAAMLVKSAVFEKIGFLDEEIFMYGEDVDFCWRAKKARLKVAWTDEAKIVHIGGASTNVPKYTQWRGEFSGLLYVYKKSYGFFQYLFLKLLIFFFLGIRILVYTLVAKLDYAKTYAKIAISI